MAITICGVAAGIAAEVDGTTFRALRVTLRPQNYGEYGFYRFGAITGTMAGGLSSNSEICQFRWTHEDSFAVLNFAQLSASANLATAGSSQVHFELSFVNKWTTIGSGGTRFIGSGAASSVPVLSIRAHQHGIGSYVNDLGIATTAALTLGTKFVHSGPLNKVGFLATTAAVTVANRLPLLKPRDGILFDSSETGMPVVIGEEEGFVIRLNINAAMPATMTWNGAINLAWAEVVSF